MRGRIARHYGAEYLPEKPNFYKSKKGAQDAHEAIRPTYLDRDPESIKRFLGKDEYALYRLIWNRFVASQMRPALFDETIVDIEAGRVPAAREGLDHEVPRLPRRLRGDAATEKREEKPKAETAPGAADGSASRDAAPGAAAAAGRGRRARAAEARHRPALHAAAAALLARRAW